MSPPPPINISQQIQHKNPNKNLLKVSQLKSAASSSGEGVVRRKKKLVSQGGQKWFKGSPRKSRANNNNNGGGTTTVITLSGHHQQQAGTMGAYLGSNQNILHHSGMESPPPLPPLLVQFSLEGLPDFRLSIYDKLNLTSKENDEVGWTGLTVSSKSRQKKKSKVPPKEVKGDEGVKGDEKGGVESKIVDVAVKPLPQPLFHEIYEYELLEASPLPNAYIRWMERPGEELTEDVEYDVDEEDSAWLNLINKDREGVGGRVSLEVMELLMDRLEKESYLQMQVTGMDQRPVIDDDAVCCICMDGECQNSNAILFCDMCNLAVHQECYGVPYIPEGQWLCRRCLQSPSRAVDCVLCPNKGGAFKQTDDGRWAHVVCAIWIPEVCFANTVFLEPVDSVTNIPPARWRLCCFICKYKGRGACIQCHKSNCYTAFHVTCAQHAGLCMKMETVRVGSTLTVRKTAYCDNHAPPDFIRNRDGDSPTVRQKLKACRKMLAEKRSAIPMVSIPTIPPERLTQISSSVTFARKNQFIKRLLSYWKLKRIKRNGVPLLRRLQAASNHPPTANKQTHQLSFPQHVESWRGEYKYLLRLRQDLEKARLLCELIKKREKEKKEFVTLAENQWELELCPLARFFNNILNELKGKDTGEIFAEPVDPQAVPDYSRVIKNPMDLSTMKEKVSAFQYHSLSALEADFRLMIDNCLLYNNKDTVFYRAGVKMRESGRLIFREAERMAQQIGFDFDSGLHLATLSSAAQQRKLDSLQTDEEICQEIDNFLASEDRWTLPFTHHISNLEDLMDKAIGLGKPIARQRKYQKLRNEISRVKRMSRTPTTCSNANNNAYSSDAQSICSSPTNINIMSPGSEPIQSRGGNNTPNKKQRRTSTVSSKSSPLPPPINNNNNNNNKSVTSVGRRLRNKSLEVGEEEVENSVRTRPPKRRVVEALEKEAVRRRGSIYKTTLSNCVSSPSSSNLERGAESVTQTTPSSAPTTRLRRVRKSSQSVVKVFQSPPSTKTRGRKGKEIDEGGRVTRMVSNGLVSSPHSLRNGPKGVLENTGGGRRKGQHVNSHRGELKDSFSVYRETEMNSEGESEGEEPDDEEGAVTEEEEAQSSSTSSSSTSSSSDEEEEEESSDASSISPPMSLRGNSGGNNLRNVVGKKLRNLSPSTSGESSEDNSDSEEEEGSSSEGEQTRSKVTNKSKKKKGKRLKLKDDDEGSSDDEIEQGGRKSVNLEEIPLEPLSVVWAKCGDGVWSAALIIDPEMEPDFQKNGVSIPAPPNDVLLKRPGGPRRRKTDKNIFLVLFFDKSRPRWEWVCRSELEPLGVDPELDQGHMKQGGQPACKRTRLAYEKALLHRRRTDGAGLQPFLHNQNQLPISPPSE